MAKLNVKSTYRRILKWTIVSFKAIQVQQRWNVLKETLVRFFQGISYDNLKDDLRKLSIFLIGGGLVGLIVAGDKVAGPEAFLMFLFGLVFWLIGLYRSDGGE